METSTVMTSQMRGTAVSAGKWWERAGFVQMQKSVWDC